MRRGENSPFKTATLTSAKQCAPSSVQRICRFLASLAKLFRKSRRTGRCSATSLKPAIIGSVSRIGR